MPIDKTTSETNEALASALEYASREMEVQALPIGVEGDWSPTSKYRTTVAQQCSRLGDVVGSPSSTPYILCQKWSYFPDANPGIVTGRSSNVFVVSINGQAGAESLRLLEDQHGPLPPTRTAIWGTRRDLYFACYRPVRSGADYLGTGLTVFGNGACVAAPPSRNASGEVSRWEDENAQFAGAPKWLKAAVNEEEVQPRDADIKIVGDPERGRSKPIAAGKDGDSEVSGVGDEAILDKVVDAVPATSATPCEPLQEVSLANANPRVSTATDGRGLGESRLERSNTQSVAGTGTGQASVVNLGAAPQSKAHKVEVCEKASRRKKNPLFWFALDVNQWSGDSRIAFLKDYQAGWLLWLRMEAWKRECRLPNDVPLLAKWARAASPKKFVREFDVMLQFFEPINGGSLLEDAELRQLWDEKLALVETNRENGRRGGGAKSNQSLAGKAVA